MVESIAANHLLCGAVKRASAECNATVREWWLRSGWGAAQSALGRSRLAVGSLVRLIGCRRVVVSVEFIW
jgi:hypothetical protein